MHFAKYACATFLVAVACGVGIGAVISEMSDSSTTSGFAATYCPAVSITHVSPVSGTNEWFLYQRNLTTVRETRVKMINNAQGEAATWPEFDAVKNTAVNTDYGQLNHEQLSEALANDGKLVAAKVVTALGAVEQMSGFEWVFAADVEPGEAERLTRQDSIMSAGLRDVVVEVVYDVPFEYFDTAS